MPVIFKDLTIDEASSLGDEIVTSISGGKSGGIGGKTLKAVKDEEISNSQKKRLKEAEDKIIKSLEHFPKDINKEVNDKNIDKYCSWLIKSLDLGEPFVETKDLDYSQFSAGGPGGQNVNKVANAVLYKHKITGLFANSRDSRNTIENRNHAADSLYEDLKILIDDWRVALSDIPSNKLEDVIRIFIKEVI
ncbi:peptide chain release factor-like protein [candidate division WWE3 bacterium]|uniref:Peptide chain release factor-like protein n=1 Tax=candidate division WWE3 bacterium TaxID=2053526 RepID=A0A7X9E7V1_UNCKA|nr:peptide chain release factor-like protein [candidate division WWE3 bacterium]